MGRLIPTGAPNKGHSADFEYIGEGEEEKCFMVCECGWKIEIGSFRNSWSTIEVEVRMRKHMEELGLSN